MHDRYRSMCEVIVVGAGRSRSTCLRCDAYIHDHCFEYRHDYSPFYQLPNSNLFTHRMLFSREKPLVKTMAPGSAFIIYLKNPKNTLLPFYFNYSILYFCLIFLSNTIQFNLARDRQGVDNPLFVLGCKGLLFVCMFFQ